jgi:hypothetical protein
VAFSHTSSGSFLHAYPDTKKIMPDCQGKHNGGMIMADPKGAILQRDGIDEYGCGLCQTGVPCESINPVKHPGDTRIPGVHIRQDHNNNPSNSS